MWSVAWGASTTVVYKTHFRPHSLSICESLEEQNFHVVAKGLDKVYFCGKEVAYDLSNQRPGKGYSTARRTDGGGSGGGVGWSVSPGFEVSPLVLCEMRVLSKEEIWMDIRTDDGSSNVSELFVALIEKILRKEHGVYTLEKML
jgi:hypothetical protein